MMLNGFFDEYATGGLDHAEDFLRDVKLLWSYTCAEDEAEDEDYEDEEDEEEEEEESDVTECDIEDEESDEVTECE